MWLHWHPPFLIYVASLTPSISNLCGFIVTLHLLIYVASLTPSISNSKKMPQNACTTSSFPGGHPYPLESNQPICTKCYWSLWSLSYPYDHAPTPQQKPDLIFHWLPRSYSWGTDVPCIKVRAHWTSDGVMQCRKRTPQRVEIRVMLFCWYRSHLERLPVAVFVQHVSVKDIIKMIWLTC